MQLYGATPEKDKLLFLNNIDGIKLYSAWVFCAFSLCAKTAFFNLKRSGDEFTSRKNDGAIRSQYRKAAIVKRVFVPIRQASIAEGPAPIRDVCEFDCLPAGANHLETEVAEKTRGLKKRGGRSRSVFAIPY